MDSLQGNYTTADWNRVQNFIDAAKPSYGSDLIRGIALETLVIGIASTTAGTFAWKFIPQRRKRSWRIWALIVGFLIPWTLLVTHWGLALRSMETFIYYGALGNPAVYDYIGPFILETFLYGAFCTLLGMGGFILLQRGFQYRSHSTLASVVIFMFLVASTHWGLQVYCVFATQLHPLNILPIASGPTVILSVNIILGDMIVLWRMCVLWKNNKAVIGLSATIISTMIAVSILNILNAQRDAEYLIATDQFRCFSSTHSLATHVNASPTSSTIKAPPKNSDIYGEITLMLSFISNFTATVMIAIKAWMHRRRLHGHLFLGDRRTIAEKFMTLLVESGLLYSFMWALYIVSTKTTAFDTTLEFPRLNATLSANNSTTLVTIVPDTEKVLGSDWFNRGMAQITGIYPTIVIALVAFKRSHCESEFTYKEWSNGQPSSGLASGGTGTGGLPGARRGSRLLATGGSASEGLDSKSEAHPMRVLVSREILVDARGGHFINSEADYDGDLDLERSRGSKLGPGGVDDYGRDDRRGPMV